MALREALLVTGLLAAVVAAPVEISAPPNASFKCCSTSLREKPNTFADALNIDSLTSCKAYCRSKGYGSPVLRHSGWACATDKAFRCPEVPVSFCSSLFSETKGYYRYYPLSASEFTQENVTRTTRRGDTSTVEIEDTNRGERSRRLIGGRQNSLFATRTIDRIDSMDSNLGQINISKSMARTFNFDGPARAIGPNNAVILGSGGTASITEIRRGNLRNTSNTAAVTTVNDGQNSSSQDITVGGQRRFRRADGRLSVTTDDRSTNRRSDNTSVATTSISVGGTAMVGTSSLLTGSLPMPSRGPLNIRGLSTNVDVRVIRGTGTATSVGTGRRNTRSRSIDTKVALNRGPDGAVLRELRADAVGNKRENSESSGTIQSSTERAVVSKEGVGTTDHATNKTAGTSDNRTTTLDTNDVRTTINTTSECGSCEGTGRDVIRSNTVKDAIVDTAKKFNDTKVSTTTAADGKVLFIEGQTRNENTGTKSDIQAQGTVIHDRGGNRGSNCDPKTGTCQQESKHTGRRVTRSRNSTIVNDTVDKVVNKVVLANFG